MRLTSHFVHEVAGMHALAQDVLQTLCLELDVTVLALHTKTASPGITSSRLRPCQGV